MRCKIRCSHSSRIGVQLRQNTQLVRNGAPIDPWGNPYIYKYPGQKQDFDLISYGADGKTGGISDDSDISN
jgi:general secretion pathway protein G